MGRVSALGQDQGNVRQIPLLSFNSLAVIFPSPSLPCLLLSSHQHIPVSPFSLVFVSHLLRLVSMVWINYRGFVNVWSYLTVKRINAVNKRAVKRQPWPLPLVACSSRCLMHISKFKLSSNTHTQTHSHVLVSGKWWNWAISLVMCIIQYVYYYQWGQKFDGSSFMCGSILNW